MSARRLIAALILTGLTLAAAGAARAAAATPSQLVSTIETFRWSPPSPDPSGLAYDAAANRLLVVDGEVEEMSIYKGANYYEAGLNGLLLRSTNTLRFTPEPVGIAYGAGKIWISDDDEDEIYEISLGSDGRFDALDSVRTFGTRTYGVGDPEGLSYDAAGNRLILAGGEESEIVTVSAVDGVFGNSNDTYQRIDSRAAANIVDPEAAEFRPETGTLLTIGTDDDRVVELTPSGGFVSEIDTSYLPLSRPAGLAWGPRSTDATKKSLYISDRKVDNDNAPSENDGAIYEIAIGTAADVPQDGVRVATGSDDAEQQLSNGRVTTNGSDLEMVSDGTVQQSVGVRFNGVDVPAGATISKASIQFTADESQSVATTLDIRAQAADNAPTFTTATNDISSRSTTSARATWSPPAWTANDAGAAQRTTDLAAVLQEVVSRPGWSKGNAVAFVITGTGHRTAEPFEGGASRAPLLRVEYLTDAPPPTNQPPSVNAGPDQTVTLPSSASLDGTVTDDGRPNATPATTWSKVSGSGTVTFANASAVDTTASFSAAGTYVLRLTANDGALTASDDVTVVVNPADTGGGGGTGAIDIRIAARPDDAEETAGGLFDAASSDLEMVTDGANQQLVGLRFPGAAIPRGATITRAYVQFTVDEAQSVSTSLTIKGEASDNPVGFSSTTRISTRPLTSASASWSPPAWSTVGAAGADQRTPDLSTLVQQAVNRSGWASGNALAFVITGTGHRTAEAFDGVPASAPLLHVEWS